MSAWPSRQTAYVGVASIDDGRAVRGGAARRILLADRVGPARRALAGLLGDLEGVVLVGQVEERDQLAGALGRTSADVLVIDDRLLRSSDHVLAGLGRHRAGVRVLVVGVDDEPAFAARARRQGADAWIAKDRADEELPALLAGS